MTAPAGFAAAGAGRNWALLALLAVASLAMAAPLLWTLLLSLKPNGELLRSTQSAFSPPYTLQNYADILGHSAVFGWLLNSTIVSLAVTLGVLALSSLAGYGFARLRFPGRGVIFIVVLFGLAIPEQSVIIARHQMFSALNLHNTYRGLILPGLAAPFGVFLMTQYSAPCRANWRRPPRSTARPVSRSSGASCCRCRYLRRRRSASLPSYPHGTITGGR